MKLQSSPKLRCYPGDADGINEHRLMQYAVAPWAVFPSVGEDY